MKKFMYFMTMLFNISGILFCISMIFTLKSVSLMYLPVILFSIAIFTFSFGVTFLDYVNKISNTKNKYAFQRPQISDYREYFIKRKNEFLI